MLIRESLLENFQRALQAVDGAGTADEQLDKVAAVQEQLLQLTVAIKRGIRVEKQRIENDLRAGRL